MNFLLDGMIYQLHNGSLNINHPSSCVFCTDNCRETKQPTPRHFIPPKPGRPPRDASDDQVQPPTQVSSDNHGIYYRICIFSHTQVDSAQLNSSNRSGAFRLDRRKKRRQEPASPYRHLDPFARPLAHHVPAASRGEHAPPAP